MVPWELCSETHPSLNPPEKIIKFKAVPWKPPTNRLFSSLTPQVIFTNPYIFATKYQRPTIFETLNLDRLNTLRFAACKDKGIGKFAFLATARFLSCTETRAYLCTEIRVYLCTENRFYLLIVSRVYLWQEFRFYLCTETRAYLCTETRAYLCIETKILSMYRE